jgi:peptide/nickel transport system permease protein
MQFPKRKPFGFWAGMFPVLILSLFAAFPAFFAPYDPFEQNADEVYQSPSWSHPFGTDNVGSDVLSKVIYGTRVTFVVGGLAAAAGTLIAVTLGLVSGYFGRWVDMCAQRFVDAVMAFPGLILLLLIVAVVGQGRNTVIVAIAIFLGIAPSRVIRSAVLTVRNESYVEAARALGCSDKSVMSRHILPNIVPVAIVLLTVGIGSAILIEASLGFLGLGVPPPNASWGYMIGSIGRVSVLNAPWIGIFPGLALSITVFAFNVWGDALRDLLDPRMRGLDPSTR